MQATLNQVLGGLKTYAELPVEEIRTLDPVAYTSPELYALEIEHIWKKEWVCVAHTCELKKPGDFVAFDLLDEPMMLVRGDDMQIRAVSTVCRHRFMPVVRHGERGNASRFQCPYHRWTYGTDGQLNQALYMEENRAFEMSKVRLPEFRCEIWHDLIWVNLDDDAEPLAPRVADLDETFKVYEFPESESWVNPYPYDELWSANWKLCVENNEAYHSMGVHNESLEPYVPTRNIQNPTHGDYWAGFQDLFAVETGVAQNMLKALDWKPGDMGQEKPALEIYVICPTNSFVISPGGAGFYTHWPTGLDQTRAWMASLQPEARWRKSVEDNGHPEQPNRVLDEDRFAYEAGIGRAVYSDKLEAGPCSWMEEIVLRCHQWTARKLLEAVG